MNYLPLTFDKPTLAKKSKDSYTAFNSYDGRMAFVHSGKHQGKYVYLICSWNQEWLVEFVSQYREIWDAPFEHINISDMIPLFDPPAYEA